MQRCPSWPSGRPSAVREPVEARPQARSRLSSAEVRPKASALAAGMQLPARRAGRMPARQGPRRVSGAATKGRRPRPPMPAQRSATGEMKCRSAVQQRHPRTTCPERSEAAGLRASRRPVPASAPQMSEQMQWIASEPVARPEQKWSPACASGERSPRDAPAATEAAAISPRSPAVGLVQLAGVPRPSVALAPVRSAGSSSPAG